jgi:[phosphatase 2A protein]-leucine-carboxy methyltransferase
MLSITDFKDFLSLKVTARGNKMQILSIGAGFDTLYWRLKERGTPFSNLVEVDLPGVTSRKCVFIKRSKTLLDTIGVDNVRLSRTELHGVDYHLLAEDFTRTAQLEKKLHECCGWNFNSPTIVLAECVLVYVPTPATTAFLSWCTTTFTSSLVFLNYEQLNMRDRFGQVMLDNLAVRGCVLSGVDACRDKQSQIERFTAAHWSEASCWTMNETHALLPRQEVEEAEARERLDERELVQQLFDHYCITVAWRNAPPSYIWDDIDWW